MEIAPVEKTEIIVNGNKVLLNPDNMKFNESNLSEYLEREYGWVDYFGKQLEFANKEVLLAEIDYDSLYSKKYVEVKSEGETENYAKAAALSDDKVVEAKKRYVDRKEAVGLLKAHLKAWDKSHENAQNRAVTLRKELEKLNRDVYANPDTYVAEDFKA